MIIKIAGEDTASLIIREKFNEYLSQQGFSVFHIEVIDGICESENITWSYLTKNIKSFIECAINDNEMAALKQLKESLP